MPPGLQTAMGITAAAASNYAQACTNVATIQAAIAANQAALPAAEALVVTEATAYNAALLELATVANASTT